MNIESTADGDTLLFVRHVQISGHTTLQVGIPRPMVQKLNIRKGDEVQIWLQDGKIIMQFGEGELDDE